MYVVQPPSVQVQLSALLHFWCKALIALGQHQRMKGLCRRLCGVHPVRVIHGSGQVLYLTPKITVEEVLLYYPHHFLCQPGLNSYSGFRSNQMLALDTQLQSGCIYFLFPLPRLFPTAPSVSSQSCTCFQFPKDQHNPSPTSSSLFYDSPRKAESGMHEGGSRSSTWCCSKNSKSQVVPESNLYSAGRRDVMLKPNPLQQLPWRPRLGCISEEEDLEVCLEDAKQFWVKFWKRYPSLAC